MSIRGHYEPNAKALEDETRTVQNSAPANPLAGEDGADPIPRAQPFGPRLSYPTPKLVPTPRGGTSFKKLRGEKIAAAPTLFQFAFPTYWGHMVFLPLPS